MADLNNVYKIYDKYLYVSDRKRIDAVLGVALTRKRRGTTPIWLIVIGSSGDWKSVQINALEDSRHTITLHNLTKNTLVSGYKKAKDLAPQLDGKVVLIPEMASILKLHPNEKAEIWAQLRDLFDGFAGKVFGTGKRIRYKDLHTTLIMGSTPAIDDQILIHQDLGTRELLYRTSNKDKIKGDIMNKVWDNEMVENKMKEDLNHVTTSFLNSCSYNDQIIISPEVKEKLFGYSKFLATMRTAATINSYSGELVSHCSPEIPTRVLKQLKILYKALRSLDDKYPDTKALEVIQHIVVSSCSVTRIDALSILIEEGEPMSTKKISNELRLGYRTALRELNTLWNLKLIDKEITTISTEVGNKNLERWVLSAKEDTTKIIDDLKDYVKKVKEE